MGVKIESAKTVHICHFTCKRETLRAERTLHATPQQLETLNMISCIALKDCELEKANIKGIERLWSSGYDIGFPSL
jgi:hypothetical protein